MAILGGYCILAAGIWRHQYYAGLLATTNKNQVPPGRVRREGPHLVSRGWRPQSPKGDFVLCRCRQRKYSYSYFALSPQLRVRVTQARQGPLLARTPHDQICGETRGPSGPEKASRLPRREPVVGLHFIEGGLCGTEREIYIYTWYLVPVGTLLARLGTGLSLTTPRYHISCQISGTGPLRAGAGGGRRRWADTEAFSHRQAPGGRSMQGKLSSRACTWLMLESGVKLEVTRARRRSTSSRRAAAIESPAHAAHWPISGRRPRRRSMAAGAAGGAHRPMARSEMQAPAAACAHDWPAAAERAARAMPH